MKLNKIKLKNILCHKEIEVDFNEPLTAILGENGRGKTALIESVVACLYGAFPSRPGSLYNKITEGFEGEASMTVDFMLNEESYRARRSMRKTGKTTSSECSLWKFGQLLVGPKTGDFEQAIVNLLGTQEAFLSSVFSSQFNAGDLCSARPAERKAVFGQLLGLGRYDKISQAAKEKGKDLEEKITIQQSNIAYLRLSANNLDQTRADYINAKEEKINYNKLLEAQKIKVSDLETKIREWEIANEKSSGLKNQINKMKSEIGRLELEVEADRLEYKKLMELTAKADEIEQAEKDLAGAQERQAGQQEKLREGEKILSDLRLLESEVGNRRVDLKRAQDQSALLDDTPNQDCCKNCYLVGSAQLAKTSLPKLEKNLFDDEATLAELKNSIEAQGIMIVKENLAKTLDEIAKLKKLTINSAKLREAQGKMQAMKEAGITRVKTITVKKSELENLTAELSEAGTKDSGASPTDLTLAKRKQSELENKLSELSGKAGGLKERIGSMEKSEKEAEEQETGIKDQKQSLDDYRTIEQAFGRSGLQPLLIEQARPELESIAAELSGKATGGKMQVRFETQKELKSGDMAESLDIIITMNGQERKIEDLSGGEQKLIRTAVRLTLAVFQARRGGSRLRTLFIDEAFENLDAENSGQVLELLKSLQGQFDRIIIISHDDDLLAELPNRITL